MLEVAGCARERMESWQKWSFPFRPLSPDSGDPPGWTPVAKRRRISQFSRASRQIVAPAAGRASCGVRWTHQGPHPWSRLVDAGVRGGWPRRSAPQRTPGHRRARARPGPAVWCATRPRSIPVLCAVAVPAARRRQRRQRLTTVRVPNRLVRRSARHAAPADGNARDGATAADHSEAVRLALRVHGRSQAGPISWPGWRRTELDCVQLRIRHPVYRGAHTRRLAHPRTNHEAKVTTAAIVRNIQASA